MQPPRSYVSLREDGTGLRLDLDWLEAEGVMIALELYRLNLRRYDGARVPPTVAERRERVREIEQALAGALADAEGVFR